MKPKKKRWERMYRTSLIPMTEAEIDAHIAHAREVDGKELTREEIARQGQGDEVWTNDTYQCVITYLEKDKPFGWMHLSIKRRNRGVIRDWRVLQRIKNECAGPEREAVEIFPAESRLVDTANQYHLWALPEGEKLPFGFNERLVTDEVGATGARQRPFDE